jgi:hypothetical protein
MHPSGSSFLTLLLGVDDDEEERGMVCGGVLWWLKSTILSCWSGKKIETNCLSKYISNAMEKVEGSSFIRRRKWKENSN